MPFATAAERALAQAVSQLVHGNPFLPERLEAERAALGDAFDPAGTLWHAREEPEPPPNAGRLAERVVQLTERGCERLARGARPRPEDLAHYQDCVLYRLYDEAQADLYRLVVDPRAATGRVPAFERFRRDLERLLTGAAATLPAAREAGHLFACAFQVRRAFHHIFANILGPSAPARRLRAVVWQSIFTRDQRRYRRALYARMGDIPTLIEGPSGTGKELVAHAIAQSRYLPFDAERQGFAAAPRGLYFPLHLAALSPTLIESELFGHRRGAFTGALQDRAGWFEVCGSLGAVFLDEIGEVAPAIQVKLLRVLQGRTFQRLGDTQDRRFAGKLIAATNRDLAAEIAAGRFREDLYYRLCADLITTPSLAARLRDAPEERGVLVRALARRIAGEEEAEALATETEAWIRTHLAADYPWPGNVRELEQCVRNVLIRGAYQPRAPRVAGARTAFAHAVLDGALTMDELQRRYCTLVYAQTGSYVETARRTGLDRRTARLRVDRAFLRALRADGGAGGDGAGPDPIGDGVRPGE